LGGPRAVHHSHEILISSSHIFTMPIYSVVCSGFCIVTMFGLMCGPKRQLYRTFIPPITHPSNSTGLWELSPSFFCKYVAFVPLPAKRRAECRDYRPGNLVARQTEIQWWAPLPRPPAIMIVLKYSLLVCYTDLAEHLGLWVSQPYNPIHFGLIPPSETPWFTRPTTQPPDSTQIMFRPHSKRARACDWPTDSDSTRTAPMSTKKMEHALADLLPTNSNHMWRSSTICPPITVITSIPSSTIPTLPILHLWREALMQHAPSCCSAPSCHSHPSSCTYGFAH